LYSHLHSQVTVASTCVWRGVTTAVLYWAR
jgi:hypothetical protein